MINMHWGLLEILIFAIYLAAIILIVFFVSRKYLKDAGNKASNKIKTVDKESDTTEY